MIDSPSQAIGPQAIPKPVPIDYRTETPVNARKRQGGIPIVTAVTVTADGTGNPVKLLDENPRRLEAWIYNNGTVAIAIAPDKQVTYAAGTIKPGYIIPPGGQLLIDTTTCAWYAVANGGSGNDVRLTEISDNTGQLP